MGIMNYSIGALCKEFDLSRSTLLYYDKIGLLSASIRTDANYRRYTEEERTRLRRICTLRETGISLNQIKDLLDTGGMTEGDILEKRINELNREIRFLKCQQKLIIEILKGKKASGSKMVLDRQAFTVILKSTGLDDQIMERLHVQFEKDFPELHQVFLEFLGIDEAEIESIRSYSRKKKKR